MNHRKRRQPSPLTLFLVCGFAASAASAASKVLASSQNLEIGGLCLTI